jgi:hypothetical protein
MGAAGNAPHRVPGSCPSIPSFRTKLEQSKIGGMEMLFRVWDKVNKKMIYPESDNEDWFAVDMSGTLAKVGFASVIASEYTIEVMKDTEAVYMFSTGYQGNKGENVEEIYVDDILKVRGTRQKIFRIKTLADMEMPFETSGAFLGAYEGGDIEIMGNIHENPELLKGVAKS